MAFLAKCQKCNTPNKLTQCNNCGKPTLSAIKDEKGQLQKIACTLCGHKIDRTNCSFCKAIIYTKTISVNNGSSGSEDLATVLSTWFWLFVIFALGLLILKAMG